MLLYAGPVIRVREILKKTAEILRASCLEGSAVPAWRGVAAVLCALLLCCPTAGAFTHFEARQMHPLTLTPDGKHLLAVNSTEGRLSVFDVSDASNVNPVLVAEIPVGLEPVSVAAPTNDEAWVVNEVSDTVSVVSLSRRIVVATLPASDEPSRRGLRQGPGICELREKQAHPRFRRGHASGGRIHPCARNRATRPSGRSLGRACLLGIFALWKSYDSASHIARPPAARPDKPRHSPSRRKPH